MKAIIDGKSIIYGDNKINIDDLYTDEFYAYSNEQASKFYNDTYGVNEIFNNLIQDYLVIDRWLLENKPKRVDIGKAFEKIAYLTFDICNKNGIDVTGLSIIRKIQTYIIFQAFVLSSTLYFIWLNIKISYRPGIKVSEKFAVLRSKASIKKFKNFPEIAQEIEDPYNRDSIYRLFPVFKRIGWCMRSYIRAFKTLRSMNRFYAPLLGDSFKYSLYSFYKKRIVHTELYKQVIEQYFSHFNGKEFYTGNNLDRYSVIEDNIARRYNIRTYNIPHGIEYGFRFPKGFSSDVFYAHSRYTADYLNKLYETSKFVYDESIIKKMYDYGYDILHDQMVIFFTEPRDVYVNLDIIQKLLPAMENLGEKLYLKLHPGDNKENYKNFDVEYCTDYNLSLTGNICISRKSTVLLEALYNHSISLAIITTPKDNATFNQFPSLNADGIIKTYSVREMIEVIKDNLR